MSCLATEPVQGSITNNPFDRPHCREPSAVFMSFSVLPGSVETQLGRSYTFYNFLFPMVKTLQKFITGWPLTWKSPEFQSGQGK